MPVASVTCIARALATIGVEVAEAFDVRRMRQDAAGVSREAIPLRDEVVAAVIADLSMRSRGRD